MNLFSTLLNDLAARPMDSCGGECFDSCAGVSQHVNDCQLDCMWGCRNDSSAGATLPCLACDWTCVLFCVTGCGSGHCGVICNGACTAIGTAVPNPNPGK